MVYGADASGGPEDPIKVYANGKEWFNSRLYWASPH